MTDKIKNCDPVVLTHGGQYVNIISPDPDTLDILDIAHGLSNICRYTGQTSTFYSVAEHSVRCAQHLRRLGYSPMAQMAALLHDATEAYIQDISTPLKRLLPGYRTLEDNFALAIEQKFGVDITSRPEVRMADLQLLATERSLLFTEQTPWAATDGIDPAAYTPVNSLGMEPAKARGVFLYVFKLLTHEIEKLNGV